MRILLKPHARHPASTILTDDATIEVRNDMGEGRAVISFLDGNLVIADDDFEGAIITKRVSG